MEDAAIRDGFAHLKPSTEYDALFKAALCRERADWLVGINATRLFSCLHGVTLNVGRVMTPTLAMTVEREAAIEAFHPEPFYMVMLKMEDCMASSERFKEKAQAEELLAECRKSSQALVQKSERREKFERPPALYDLTTLQRDANRMLGYSAQQTLDYTQALYEKKLVTYPRTDSRYLTEDMAAGLPGLVMDTAVAFGFRGAVPVHAKQVIHNQKVSDHHAILPTQSVAGADLSSLPAGEASILRLIVTRLLAAVGEPYRYAETTVQFECAGQTFTAKGRTVLDEGWKAVERAVFGDIAEKVEENLDVLTEAQDKKTLPIMDAQLKEGRTAPPKHFTEDTLLSAMETAGKDDMPENAERKGLGTPATRAGILEKLVSTGFLERKKSKKTVQLLPSHDAISLITVLPEQLQSPLLTAEWEYRLGEIERGELSPEDFMAGISAMLRELVETYQVIKGTEYLFSPPREVVGKCPRCGGEVAEMQKGFFCQNQSCKFAIWKNSKWWEMKRKQPTKAIVTALLKDGRAHVSGLYSEKSGKTYNATVILEDDGKYANFKLEFDRQKGGGK